MDFSLLSELNIIFTIKLESIHINFFPLIQKPRLIVQLAHHIKLLIISQYFHVVAIFSVLKFLLNDKPINQQYIYI